MHKLVLRIANNNQKICPILIGSNILGNLSGLHNISSISKAAVVTDSNIPAKFIKMVKSACPVVSTVITLPAGEKAKNIHSVQLVWKKLGRLRFDRKSLVINLGGGTVSDIGGFAASTFMRGIDYINIPTTLLSQADAGTGGKTGFNFLGIKNLIGSFAQPKAVIIDVDTLQTLPSRELISGFGEIIKHGLVADNKLFNFATSKSPVEFSADDLADIIKRSLEIKSDIVGSDEKETNGRRMLLNFGHTIGHALESLSLTTEHPLLHGEAVILGMQVETTISKILGLISQKGHDEIIRRLSALAGLSDIRIIPPTPLLSIIRSDKKNERGETIFTLISAVGKAITNINVSDGVIFKSLHDLKKEAI